MVNYPKDWEITTIGKCGQLIKNSINPQLLPKTYFWEYSMPAFDESRRPHKSLGANMLSNRIAIKGNVLLFNKLNVRQKRIWFIGNCLNNSVCSSEFLPYYSDTVNLYFLSKLLSSDKVTRDFIEMSVGSSNSQKRIRPKDFMNYPICIPSSIEEQRLIAETLSQFDTYIFDLDELIEKKRNIRDGAIEDLVTGKTRLNGFKGKWKEVFLYQVAYYKKGKGSIEERKYISTENMNQNFSGIERFKGNNIFSGYSFDETDILMANIRPYLKKIWYATFSGCCSLDVLVIKSNGNIDSKLLYYQLANDLFINYVMSGGIKGTKMPRGDKKYIMNFRICIPQDIEEQQAIASVLTSMDNEIESLEMERDKMIQIREGAMDELLTGRVRLTK